MGDQVEIRKTRCYFCGARCKVEVEFKNGEAVEVRGARQTEGGMAGFTCEKARLGALDLNNHPNRLNYPMKRAGERGEGKWQRISWEQAMDEIADKIARLKERYGTETIGGMFGNGSWQYRWLAHRWFNLFGSPNRFTTNMNCYSPMAITEFVVYGSYGKTNIPPEPGVTKCMVMCGVSPHESSPPQWTNITKSQKLGAKLIVIDPRCTPEAKIADMWLQIRPGTDAALLNGMLNVIIREELYDKEFVSKWCQGFEDLKNYTSHYPPEIVEGITWIPREKIIEAARTYATNKPAQMGSGWGVTYSQLGGSGVLQANLAKCALRAITGNLDIEGGIFMADGLDPERFNYEANMHWDTLINHPLRKRDNVSAERFPAGSVRGFALFREVMKRAYKGGYSLDITMSPHVSPFYLWQAILEEKPYPIKALFINGHNPMATRSNTRRVYEALKSPKLELSVVSELLPTPTAMLADYLLPATDWLETACINPIDMVPNCPYYDTGGGAVGQTVKPKFERRTDFYLWRDLGRRLGQGKYWPETLEDWYSDLLQPLGYTYNEAVSKDIKVTPTPRYRKHEERGFATPSGKVELFPSLLTKLGYDLFKPFQEPPRSPVSTPELAKEYPLILTTGGKTRFLKHSRLREEPKLRRLHPDPIVQLHPDTAREKGIADGDWVYIETPEGKIKQKAEVTDKIHPKVVHAEHGWWFPEQPAAEPSLFRVWQSNVGVILPDNPEMCDFQGGPPLRALLCRVSKV